MTKSAKTQPPSDEAPETIAAPKRSLFAKFAALDNGPGDLVNLEVKPGDNKFRILPVAPIVVRKHYDFPVSAEGKILPCRRLVPADMVEAYGEAQAAGAEALEAFLSQFGKCEMCEHHAASPSHYTVKDALVFAVVQDGVVKVAEFTQASIKRQILNMENDTDWQELMPNGIEDLVLNLKKESTGPKAQNIKYTLAALPTSKPLSEEELREYMKQAPDIQRLKNPPAFDADGNAKWAEWMAKAPAPKPGEGVKVAG